MLYQLSYVGTAWKASFEYSPASPESQIVRLRPGICSTGVPVSRSPCGSRGAGARDARRVEGDCFGYRDVEPRYGSADADACVAVPIQQVSEYAARYTDDDDEVLAIGRAVRDRGHYRLEEFRRVCRWKTPRSAPLVAQNSSDSVEAWTRVALGETGSDRERIKALQSLRGVGVPTASVLLHLVYPERYPILDVRALHALGVPAPSYSYSFWESFVTEYGRLIRQAGVDGRTFDQALWQWSREQGEPSTDSVERRWRLGGLTDAQSPLQLLNRVSRDRTRSGRPRHDEHASLPQPAARHETVEA